MKKLKLFILIFLLLCLIPISINFFVINKTKNIIYDINYVTDADIALILGCSALKDGSPSKMLKDRLDKGIELYNNNKVKYILISGDHSKDYSETDAMYNYLVKNNIPKDDILIDEMGYSTSESIKNYEKKYKDKSLIIVTQKYHLYRALFIADKLNLDSIGVSAKNINYNGQIFREAREILARNKDFLLFNFK